MKKHFIFIYQNGWHQIVTPEGRVFNVNFCDDGCVIRTDEPLDEVVADLNRFIGHPIVEIYCDDPSVTTHEVFTGASLGDYDYGSPVILIKVDSLTNNLVYTIVGDGVVNHVFNRGEVHPFLVAQQRLENG